MREQIKTWQHVFKLDPDRTISDDVLAKVCSSGTDAIMVGGSSGVTYNNTADLIKRISLYDIPCVLEVSDLEMVVPGFDLYMIPLILNTNDSQWMIGQHVSAIEQYSHLMPWDKLVPEGYIVLNADSTVAQRTEALTEIDLDRAVAYAQAGDRLFHLPIIYIEYSGRFGDMELTGEIRRSTHQAQLFYGGGIRDYHSARQAKQVCDTIVVGNIIYENLQAALDTVQVISR
ncbi:heptaprenylglyceryl phosphate synthase [Paenibacillus sp. PsM32]|uniref:heptaprenylglyceryl phosphate synthase n=1 Tax=unclassified Paenibacillus TaxID=185978 RepID=UPI002365F57B|nr:MULTISPECIES: heptaprenylglyceryl phosphate synthase [unclassified Paenibacillus]MDN4620708.1 heptaprenylglyceryl phosphate synthase [Paenibacillus sp. PsM32]WDF51545.1 heptaprenylglyceryl phosphate synthase [Paenibacillus sp. KACC 21273]